MEITHKLFHGPLDVELKLQIFFAGNYESFGLKTFNKIAAGHLAKLI